MSSQQRRFLLMLYQTELQILFQVVYSIHQSTPIKNVMIIKDILQQKKQVKIVQIIYRKQVIQCIIYSEDNFTLFSNTDNELMMQDGLGKRVCLLLLSTVILVEMAMKSKGRPRRPCSCDLLTYIQIFNTLHFSSLHHILNNTAY